MKKKLFILALAAVLAAALAVTGLAAEDYYPVASAADWNEAIAGIEEAGGEAVITLTDNVDIGAAAVGVAGADITITSDGGALLTTSGDELHLVGNVTFTNVNVSAKTIYAEGHKLVLDKGFGGGEDGRQRMIVYGGSDDDLKADTHVEVYSGVYKLIAGGNSAGTGN